MENTYGIVFLTLMLSLIAWVTAHTKYMHVKRRLTSIEQMPKVSRCEFEILQSQFIRREKSHMRIATACDLNPGVVLWKEYDTGLHYTTVCEVLKDGNFVGEVGTPFGPQTYSIYKGPWYIEKTPHGKEDR